MATAKMDDVTILASAAETVIHKGIIVAGCALTPTSIRVFIYNVGGAVSLKSGEPLINLQFATVNIYRQIPPSDEIKLVGATPIEQPIRKKKKAIRKKKKAKEKD